LIQCTGHFLTFIFVSEIEIMQDQDDLMTSMLNQFALILRPIIREIVVDSYSQLQLPRIQKEEEDLMTVAEAMKYFNCSRATIFNWQRTKKITSYKLGGKLYFKKAVLTKNLKERRF
jgi:excisionase family DNA binding protein